MASVREIIEAWDCLTPEEAQQLKDGLADPLTLGYDLNLPADDLFFDTTTGDLYRAGIGQLMLRQKAWELIQQGELSEDVDRKVMHQLCTRPAYSLVLAQRRRSTARERTSQCCRCTAKLQTVSPYEALARSPL